VVSQSTRKYLKKSDVGQSFIDLTYLFCIRYLVYKILIGRLILPKVKN